MKTILTEWVRLRATWKMALWASLWLTVLHTPPLAAQHQELRHFELAKGQGSSEVYDLHLDQEGVLWYGSPSGLTRFDGYSLRTYTTADGLDDNEILKIFADSKGRLWLSTYSDRINCFDHGRIRSSRTDSLIRALPESRVYRSFVEGSDGDLWFAGSSLIQVNVEKGRIASYQANPPVGQFLHLEPDSDGSVKAYSRKAVMKIAGKDSMVVFGQTPMWAHLVMTTQMGKLIVVGREAMSVIFPGGARHYTLEEVIGKGNSILTITELSGGRIVLCTTNGAIIYRNDDFRQAPISRLAEGHEVSDVVEDPEGLCWVSTLDEGLFLGGRYNIQSYSEKDGIPIAYCLLGRPDGSIWAGGGDGEYYKLEKGKTEVHGLKSTFNFQHRRMRILAMVENAAGELYCGGDAGMVLQGNQWRKDINLDAIKQIVVGPSGRLWVSCPYLVSWGANESPPAARVEAKLLGFRYPVLDLCFNHVGEMLLGSKYGLLRWKNEEALLGRTIPDTLFHEPVNDIVALNDRTWLSLGARGTALMLPDTIILVTVADRLTSNLGTCIAARSPWEAWLGTRSGLNRIRIDPVSHKVEVLQLDELDGLIGDEINDILIVRDTVWVATSRGISFFDARNIVDRAISPHLQLQQIVIAERDTLEQGPVDLHHSRSSVQFQLFAAGYTGQQPPSFRYRMQGLDQEWQEATRPWIRYSSLPPGKYEFQARAYSGKGKVSQLLTIPVTVTPPWYARTWGIPLIMLAIGMVILGILATHLRITKRRLQAEMQVLLAEQKALRAQMNPHFLFNALNAIQGFFMRQKMVEGNQYLKKFSTMIRRILENSDKIWLPIAEELEVIRPYMEFEQLRSGQSFEFELNMGPGIHARDEEIPAMLVQPLLENAIWHGIRHKKEKGKVSLSFSKAAGVLRIVVEDDGVGRAAARENEGDRPDHRSMGLQLIRDRIQVVERMKHTTLDLHLADGDTPGVVGTKVTLTIKRKA